MKQIERRGSSSTPITEIYPRVRGGVCEFCGVLDRTLPSQEQYKLCPHFRGLGTLRCSYCPDHRNPDDVVKNSTMIVHGSPNNPNELVVVCGAFNCVEQHEKRFQVGAK